MDLNGSPPSENSCEHSLNLEQLCQRESTPRSKVKVVFVYNSNKDNDTRAGKPFFNKFMLDRL